MLRSVCAVLLLSAVIFAGCADDDVPPEEDRDNPDAVLTNAEEFYASHHCVEEDVRPRVYAPDATGPDTEASPWEIGDWWRYSLKIDGQQLPDTKLVYYADQDFDSRGVAQHYMVGTPTREEALHHALYSTNPVVGRVHRLLYSPHESGSHADMFHFPLCDGSTWRPSTEFFGTEFWFEASHETLTFANQNDPLGFRIRGDAADGSEVTHTYSPLAKWFTEIHYKGADDTRVDMILEDFGTGATGQAYFLRAQKDVVYDLTEFQPGAFMPATREHGGNGPYDSIGAAIRVDRLGGENTIEVHLLDPAGESVACAGSAGTALLAGATECPAATGPLELDYEEGDWAFDIRTSGVGNVQYEGEARLVSIYDRSCAVGGASCGN